MLLSNGVLKDTRHRSYSYVQKWQGAPAERLTHQVVGSASCGLMI